jgi:6-phosphofructokinase
LIKLETLQVPTIDCFVEVMGRDAGHIALNAGMEQELKKYLYQKKIWD